MASIIRLSAVTALPRHEALQQASAALAEAGGWVEDVHDYAGHAVTFGAGIPGSAVPALLAGLAARGIGTVADCFAPTDGDCRLTLAISFAHPDDAARREVPPVPG